MSLALKNHRLSLLSVAALSCTSLIPGLGTPVAVARPSHTALVTEERAGRGVAAGQPIFESNRGQAPAAVRFIARGVDSSALFLRDRVVWSHSERSVVMRFAGASTDVVVSGVAASRARVNYLRGAEPGWVTGVPTFGRVRYTELYPGVDVDFYGTSEGIEYDFRVAPGADPGRIALVFDGAEVTLRGDGSLRLGTTGLDQSAPRTYQGHGTSRRTIPSRFELDGDRASFALGAYDPTETLVIDPIVEFTTLVGGHGEETGQGIVVDPAGYIYVAGETTSPDFETTAGAWDRDFSGPPFDGFIAKLHPDGDLLWATFLGGSKWDAIHRQNGLALGPDGSLYLTGFTHSPDFPTRNAFDPLFNGPYDAFVAKMPPTGDDLLFSTFVGGATGAIDAAKAIVVDEEGSAYITGQMMSVDMPLVGGGFQEKKGALDAFLAKVDTNGDLKFFTFLGGTEGIKEDGQSLALGEDGIVYIAGVTEASDFPTTAGAFQEEDPGGRSLFVAAVDVAGGRLLWSTYLGGSDAEGDLSLQATGVAVDPQGHVYVAGSTKSTDFPTTPQAYSSTLNRGAPATPVLGPATDVIVSKLKADGSDLIYSTLVGGSKNDVANTILVDRSQKVWVIGKTYSDDMFDEPDPSLLRGGGSDGFVFRLAASGQHLEFGGYIGGAAPLTDGGPGETALTAEESSISATLDAAGAIYITGIASTSDFQTTDGRAVSGAWDAYVMKITDPPGAGDAARNAHVR